MKRSVLSLAALSAAFALAGFSLGHAQAGASAPATNKKLVHVSTIRGANFVREFQANVELVRAQRQAVLDMQAKLANEKDAKKKKALQADLDKAVAKLNENNAAMTKAYGFSLNRNYTMEIEAANIYLEVSDEEAAKLQAAQQKKAEKAK